MTAHCDILVKNAKVFDGSKMPAVQDIAITNGKISARGIDIEESNAERVIDASGKWAMPGLFDIHTHYDLELELAPGLPESTRHGTTTVVIANCSLGLAYGSQRRDGADPIVDCYARVENIPKSVLRDAADNISWETPEEYLHHLHTLNLGPNIATLLPHSMMRIDAMGFDASISRDPTGNELDQMKSSLKKGLDIGYVGFSTDALPFHYLANQPNTAKTIPTQFAPFSEIKALTQIVRECGAIWQATPPKDSVIKTLKTFLLTSGRLHGKPLKTTLVAALDVHNNRKIVKLATLMAKLLNSKLLQGKFYLQALGAPFKTWADGAVTPLSEEIPELRRLNETDLDEVDKRAAILADPEYIKAFKAMWLKGKSGYSLERLKTKLRLEDYAFNRDLNDMNVEACPITEWEGHTFQYVFDRILSVKTGDTNEISKKEKALIKKSFFWVSDEADFMLQMLRTFDSKLCWSTISANRDLATVRNLIMNPILLPGFNDSGAHLTNMAFYDVNLRSLKLASEGGDKDVAFMVKRLTKDPADVFGIEGGTIEVGDQADVILIDPEKLKAYDGENSAQRIYREEYKHEQLVNRSDTVVPLVIISGKIAWENEQFTEEFGTTKMGNVRLGKSAATPLVFQG